jgi:hypothetical protein
MDNKDLQSRLRAVQDLKRRKYVGTQDTLNYLRRESALYENPQRISDAINREIAKEGSIFYEATPARVLGICNTISDLLSRTMWDTTDSSEIAEGLRGDNVDEEEREEGDTAVVKTSSFADSLKFHSSNPILNYKDLISGGYMLVGEDAKRVRIDPIPQHLARYLIPIFAESQTTGADDESFGTKAMRTVLDDYPLMEGQEQKIYERLADLDWPKSLSNESLTISERKIKKEIEKSELPLKNRIQKIMRDRVDHRLENRREVITDLLQYEDYSNHEDAVKAEKNDLKSSQVILEIASDDPERNRDIIESAVESIARQEFLVIALAPEKNFVDRYLAI